MTKYYSRAPLHRFSHHDSHRMSFVSSRRHIVGSLFALAGLIVYLVGASDQYWLFVVIGLYALGYFGTPKPRLRPDSAAVVQSPEAIARFLDAVVERVRRELEPPVLARVMSIVASINEVLPVLARGTMQMDGTSFAVRQIATDFLPTALDAYLRIPAAHRSRRPRDDDRSAGEILQEQLGLLDTKMRDVLLSVQRNDLQSVLDNGRFLKKRFATPPSSEAVGAAPTP
jgi:hypothetical protein